MNSWVLLSLRHILPSDPLSYGFPLPHISYTFPYILEESDSKIYIDTDDAQKSLVS